MATLAMVITMDFRGVRSGAAHGPSTTGFGLDITDTLLQVIATLPNLQCLLFDSQAGLDTTKLASRVNMSLQKLSLLSMANCQVSLPSKFFDGRSLAGLVYLDLSHTGGWARGLLVDSRSFTVQNLPNLRILKLRGKGLDATTAGSVLREFGYQLWSIDLSRNNLGDDFIDVLSQFSVRCDVNSRLQTNGFFLAEGLTRPAYTVHGGYFIDESNFSAQYCHPDRYLSDTPIYNTEYVDYREHVLRPERHSRLTGREPIRGDSVDDAVQVLAGGPNDPTPEAPDMSNHVPAPGGITHLHLNELNISLWKVKQLLAHNSGYIEHFECDRAKLLSSPDEAEGWLSKAPWLSKSVVLYGCPGTAHLFRPVMASNLRVLKIHHSLVTNTPTFAANTTRSLENTWLSETCFRKRIDLAFPQTFVPDMNPRLYSLTLSHIPRYSTGIVTRRLIHLLKLAAAQEQEIERTRAAVPHRGPPILRGLRHIRLEFEPDTRDDELMSLEGDKDVNEAMEAFSFFRESAWGPSSSSSSSSPPPVNSRIINVKPIAAATAAPQTSIPVSDKRGQPTIPSRELRLTSGPFKNNETEYYKVTIRKNNIGEEGGGGGEEKEHQLQVWIGSGVPGPECTPAVNAYMRILASGNGRYLGVNDNNDDYNNDDDDRNNNYDYVTPATPGHVAAGVPAGSYIFGRAWDRMLVPEGSGDLRRPTVAELKGMGDVLGAIKAFRQETRGRYAAATTTARFVEGTGHHEYWKGKLEIVLPQRLESSSDYWR